ncbi:Glyoxalase/Bleomycin resistance protein/Dihydroxybiphenyl dioxygenase [Rhodocollybia butyracea]|uniref:lactoylglutathione lyase n=1 Tax=Rhodocollybia butyracea TaxID=206335 RepID=A0A9P5PGZ2_9AGAR|nr:Glyoxalase/Bleomycin resistance protein/Dihydroxybiphenyl dioxygenase [Rhodocollybia butyracea]
MPRTAETASFQFNHTMIRVKDPKVSLKFYTEVIGMDLLSEKDMGDFTLYFLAFDHGQNYKSMSAEDKDIARFAREGVLELTHNHGTESDASFTGYSSGNSEPGKGFGHIAITVDNLEVACARFEKLGVPFKKRPQDGKMRNIAFILDPDGYWVEVVKQAMKL